MPWTQDNALGQNIYENDNDTGQQTYTKDTRQLTYKKDNYTRLVTFENNNYKGHQTIENDNITKPKNKKDIYTGKLTQDNYERQSTQDNDQSNIDVRHLITLKNIRSNFPRNLKQFMIHNVTHMRCVSVSGISCLTFL